jgi:conjugal transfer pilus assembly protein TraW
VSRVQGSVFRFIVERFQFLKLLSVILKQFVFLIFFFLNAEIWIRDTAHARDFGIRGKIASITEEDPILLIQSKLKTMEERGELKLHNLELQKKTRAAIERPKPVEGVTNAQKDRIFYYDPTYVVKEDLKDHQGRVFYKKGTRINPLETVNLSQGLLFFDGDDADQVAFAKEKLKVGPLKLILTKGAPLALSEEFKVPVYFDQSGHLTKQLGIHHVPSLVTQSLSSNQVGGKLSGDIAEGKLRLRIEEIALNTEKNNPSKIKKEP